MRRPATLLLALLSAFILEAQELPTFRVGSELVVVDLVVTDRAGRPVADLDAAEVQLFEDGRPQKIQFLRRLPQPSGPRPVSAEPAAAGVVPTLAPAVGSPAWKMAADGGLAIVIDLASTPVDALARTREVIARLVRDDLPAGSPVMLATLGPGVNVLAGFTDDRVGLLQALERVRPPAGEPMTMQSVLENVEQQCDLSGAVNPRATAAMGRLLISESRARLVNAVGALVAVSRSLAARPGRKQLVYFSAGYYMNPAGDVIETIAAGVAGCQGVDSERIRREIAQELASGNTDDLVLQVQTAIDRANRSQVSFYAVDPRGLVTTSPEARQRVSGRSAQRGTIQKIVALDQTRSIEYLETLAGGTGGRAFVNSNDIAQGLRRAWLDASDYYLVGYTPSGPRRKGRFHKIEVRVSRPDLQLLHRSGYFEATDREMAEADVGTALRNPGAFVRGDFVVEARFDETQPRIIVLAPPVALTFTKDGAVQTATLTVHATLRDGQGRLVGDGPILARDITLRMDAERLARLLASDNLEIPFALDRPAAGSYQLTVVARDGGGWIAAHSQQVVIGR
jgi:VWFA-related protein